MRLIAPNGVAVEACEAGAERMLANGFHRPAAKKEEEAKPEPKRPAKAKE